MRSVGRSMSKETLALLECEIEIPHRPTFDSAGLSLLIAVVTRDCRAHRFRWCGYEIFIAGLLSGPAAFDGQSGTGNRSGGIGRKEDGESTDFLGGHESMRRLGF